MSFQVKRQTNFSADPNRSRVLVFNSKDRTEGTNEQPSFKLSKTVEHISRITLQDVSIPVSWYTAGSTNKTIVCTDSFAVTFTVTLTEQNYDTEELRATLETGLLAGSADVFTVTFDDQTLKYTIADSTGNFTLDWATSTAYLLFGFAATDTVAAASVTSTNMVQLIKERVYIRMRNSNLRNLEVSNGSTSDIIGVIPNNASPGSYILWENTSLGDSTLFCNIQALRNVELALTDIDNTVLELNGVPWSGTLIIN